MGMRAMVVGLLLVCGCANDVRVRYPSAPGDPTGTIVLRLSQAASEVNVAIDGHLLVEDAHTERIVIENAPVGTPEIVVTANGADRQVKVWVGTERPTVVPLGVPDPGHGFLKSLFGSLVSIVAYSLLR